MDVQTAPGRTKAADGLRRSLGLKILRQQPQAKASRLEQQFGGERSVTLKQRWNDGRSDSLPLRGGEIHHRIPPGICGAAHAVKNR